MAQLLNRLRAEERIAGVEFWHSPERCGWLMKQGTFLLLSRKKLSTPPPPSLSRASTGRHGRKRPGSLPHSLADRSVPHPPAGEYIKTWRRRWFILKQGKIFWFKTEEVGPVSNLSELPFSSAPRFPLGLLADDENPLHRAPSRGVWSTSVGVFPSRARRTSSTGPTPLSSQRTARRCSSSQTRTR